MLIVLQIDTHLCLNWKFIEGNSHEFSLHSSWLNTITYVYYMIFIMMLKWSVAKVVWAVVT